MAAVTPWKSAAGAILLSMYAQKGDACVGKGALADPQMSEAGGRLEALKRALTELVRPPQFGATTHADTELGRTSMCSATAAWRSVTTALQVRTLRTQQPPAQLRAHDAVSDALLGCASSMPLKPTALQLLAQALVQRDEPRGFRCPPPRRRSALLLLCSTQRCSAALARRSHLRTEHNGDAGKEWVRPAVP